MPKVSVIIPAFNAAPLLGKTLESVLCQSFSDWEIIVVDDGSTDATADVAKGYISNHGHKIRLIRKENNGPASARNTGIESAAGAYIAFLDADDLWLPAKLQRQVDLFDAQPPEVGLVYCRAGRFDGDGLWKMPPEYRPQPVQGWAYEALLRVNMIPTLTVMARRSCFDRVGLFDESASVFSSEDFDMWLRICSLYRVCFFDQCLALYREHAGGINKNQERAYLAHNSVLEKHLAMAVAAGDRKKLHLLKAALARSRYELGYYHLRSGQMKKARATFDAALSLAPGSIRLRMVKGATRIPFQLLQRANSLWKRFFPAPVIVKSEKELQDLLAGNS